MASALKRIGVRRAPQNAQTSLTIFIEEKLVRNTAFERESSFKEIGERRMAEVSLFRKHQKEKKTYDPKSQVPVLHCSICTGEKVAGFKEIHTGKFEEVMLIRNEQDLAEFKEMYGIAEIRKEY